MSNDHPARRVCAVAINVVGLIGYAGAFYLAQEKYSSGSLLEGIVIGLAAGLSWMLPSIFRMKGSQSARTEFGSYDDNFWVGAALTVAVTIAFLWFFDAKSDPFVTGYFITLLLSFGLMPLIGKRLES